MKEFDIGRKLNDYTLMHDDIVELLDLLREGSHRLLVGSHRLHRSDPGVSSKYTLDVASRNMYLDLFDKGQHHISCG